jgi:hypothetical protein
MREGVIRSFGHLSRYPSAWLLIAAAIGLAPGAAGAQPPDVVQSDSHGNTAAGSTALLTLTTGSLNTAMGAAAALEDNSGKQNTAVGEEALENNSTGSYNTAVGTQALQGFTNASASYNTAIGNGALRYNQNGSNNTATGTNALYNNGSGTENTADGVYALNNNYEGNENSATGAYALNHNTNGSHNTANGAGALISNTTGNYNTAVGDSALDSNNGARNTAAGAGALEFNTTGSNNTAFGYEALDGNTTGANNVAIGYSALLALKNGNNNVALGINAGKLTTSGSHNIYIGHPGINGTENTVIRIGAGQTRTFIAGIKGVPLSGSAVVITAAGQLGVVASSARYKQDIRSLDDMTEKLSQLRPVSFQYKAEPGATHYGLIAEEVDKVMPDLVVRDEENRPESIQYQELIPLLLRQWQAQWAERERAREIIAQLQTLTARQATELAELRRTVMTRLAMRGANIGEDAAGR